MHYICSRYGLTNTIWGRESPNFVIGGDRQQANMNAGRAHTGHSETICLSTKSHVNPNRLLQPTICRQTFTQRITTMIDIDKIKEIAESQLEGTPLFLVDITATPGNEIEVVIDSDGSVDIDDCVALSRAIEERFDREEEDFELTVTSAGIGQPLKLPRQYRKLIGGSVEVLLSNGTKIIAQLRDATDDSITLAYTEMRAVEGKKRKQAFDVVNTYPLSEVKSTKEYLDFK